MKHYCFKRYCFIFLASIFVLGVINFYGNDLDKDEEIAGEIFGVPVPLSNYYFAKKVVLTFNANWRSTPRDEKELEDLVWQELILSYEAFRRGIEVSDEEINEEIDKILKSQKVDFDWRKDTKDFKKWVKDKLGEDIETFRNQIIHLLKLEKLRKQVLDNIHPQVTEEEAYQKFLDEYNTLSVELIRFDDLEEAKKFYKKIKKNPKIWEKEKQRNPDLFKRPGFVALDFLLHMWKFKRADVYKMIKMKEGEFYPPAPIYKGYAVFKILKIRPAEPKKFKEKKNYYFERVKMIKKYEGYKKWLEDLKKEAEVKVYIK
jgi:parvulin-like peptidyl-prolyl isomerase